MCEENTNKLDWKKARELINEEFFLKLGEYDPYGPKTDEFPAYHRLKFLETNISMYEPEFVDDYSIALGRLFRWLQFAIELRKEDV